MKRKLILYPLIGIVVLAGGLAGVWYWIGQVGTSPLERWIGSQVKSIASSYLNPKVEFSDLDYQRPYTVVLTKFRLTVDDPDNPGKTLDVIHVDKLRMELAEIPHEGKPIRIKALILDHPKINAIAARKDGKFMGFQNLLKETKEAPAAQEQAPRLSDVFQIVLLQIIDGQVVYESRPSGQPAMILDAINSRMDVQKDEQGWYKLAATLERQPVLGLVASGRLDLDHLVLALDTLKLNIELGPQQYSTLPGQVQQMLKEHEVTATVKLAASGQLPLGDPATGEFDVTMSLAQAHFVAGQYKGEADNVDARLLLKNRRVVLDHLDADTLRGKVHVASDVNLVDPYDGRVNVTAKDIRLEETLRSAGGGTGEPKYQGVVNTEVTLTGPMNKILTQAGGSGWLKLRNGHLVNLRVVADVGQAFSQQIHTMLSGPARSTQDTDSADLEFQFVGDKVHFTKIDLQTPSFTANGYGDVWFDKRLNLLLNGGLAQNSQPVPGEGRGGNEVANVVGHIAGNAVGGALRTAERAADAASGVGESIATGVINQVATIVVSGTIDQPQVRLEPFHNIRDSMGGR